MLPSVDRRAALALAVGGLAVRGLARPALAQGWTLGFARDPFSLGVASGDPAPDGVVLWTRLAPEPLAPLGGLPPSPIEVTWEVADDAAFTRLVRTGGAIARPELGFAVHIEVAGLGPARAYFYRFRAGRETSPTGRTRTAPGADAMPGRVRFGHAGCQHLEHGHFTAWRHLAEESDLDVVFHYGDYIYESRGRLPGQPGWGPTPMRVHAGNETVTLDDYRARYAQYKLERDLAAAHAAHPFAMTYDDHEIDNNWAGVASEEDVPADVFALRKAAALQAWYEHMPVRRAMLPRGPDIASYRTLRFGRLAAIHLLDTRQFRDDQPCGDGFNRPPCPAVARPDAQMLGAAQERWLLDGLAGSGATWQVLAQQVMMMPLPLPGGINMDQWDAYPAARTRLLEGLRERRIANPVVLTGDVHTAWAGTLALDGAPVATEFVATSITSGGDGGETRAGVPGLMERGPHLAFFNDRRGYCLHEATPERLTTTFRAVPFVSRPDAPREDRGRFVVEAGRPGVNHA